MFSAASFFDVVEALVPDAPQPLGEPHDLLPRPAVVAFYGFRGGAGRTLALAHLATILASQRLRIAALDLDVEAPGLHVALNVDVPKDAEGTVSLLRKALHGDEPLRASQHLLAAPLPEGVGRVLVLPAGPITRRYLAEIEELGVGLWHAQEHSSPLRRLVDDIAESGDVDAIFIDCRTGFSGLAATALFHLADVAVIFLPLSAQIWDGVSVLLDAARAAKSRRFNRPQLLFVPSLVPADALAKERVARFLEKLKRLYVERLGELKPDPDAEDPDRVPWPWLTGGLSYDPRLAAEGRVSRDLTPAWSNYQELVAAIRPLLNLSSHIEPPTTIDTRQILGEIRIPRGAAFAESTSIDELVQHFVAPSELSAVLDRSTALVVGAKGSGKTWLWRYLIHPNHSGAGHVPLPPGVKFIIGHGPSSVPEGDPLILTPDNLKEIETQARLAQKQTHKAFWLFYALIRLCRERVTLHESLLRQVQGTLRTLLRQLLRAESAREVREPLIQLLKADDSATLAEDLLQRADVALMDSGESLCLTYDGLDTGFQTGKTSDWQDRQERFVTSLLQLVAEWRTRLKRVLFKIFLREDIYLAVNIQNRSHLDATKHELRWRAADIWKIALNIAATSPGYTAHLAATFPGLVRPWNTDEEDLKRALFLLWGERIEPTGKQAYTANYILNRTSDAAGRLFPRTLVQVLESALTAEKERKSKGSEDRVLHWKSLQEGVIYASRQRVEDLTMEYVDLASYLSALKNINPIGSAHDFQNWMSRALRRNKATANLHMGQGGWQKVMEKLRAVGVLGPYQRAQGQDQMAIALLYRPGLESKILGLG